jgi:hypothetical protein
MNVKRIKGGVYEVGPFDGVLGEFQRVFDENPDCCKMPDWSHAYAAMADWQGPKEKHIRQALEKVYEEYEPTDQELEAEALLWDWIDHGIN